MAKTYLILGATSPMARSAASLLAQRGDRLFLASRDIEECSRITNDLTIRFGSKIYTGHFDANDISSSLAVFADVLSKLGRIDGLVVAVGEMGDPSEPLEPTGILSVLNANLTGVIPIIGLVARSMIEKGGGTIVGISSVAGDRGRQSNFVYGAAKGGFSVYLQGLRNHLFRHGVRVVTIKPGFVDTAMTYGKKGLFLVAPPERVGKCIVSALDKKNGVVYCPFFWRWIMLIIRMIPERVFMRLRL